MSNRSNGQQQEQRPTNRPVHSIRYGMVKVAVWRNMVDMGNASKPMYNVTSSRLYKDGDEWRDTQSFGYEDLLPLAKALNEAHTWIADQLVRDRQEEQQQEQPEQQQADRRPQQQTRSNGSPRGR
jgi:hypothetical protein